MYLRTLMISIILGLIPLPACANFYKYYDDTGGVNITNDYKSIPERYHSGLTVIRDADLEKRALSREKDIRRERARHEKQRLSNEAKKARRMASESSPETAVPVTDSPKETNGGSQPVQQRFSWLGRQLPLIKVCVVIAIIITAMVYFMKLIGHVLPGTVGKIIRIAMFFGVTVYVFSAYSDKAAKAFAVLRSEADVAQKAVDKRTELIKKQAGGGE